VVSGRRRVLRDCACLPTDTVWRVASGTLDRLPQWASDLLRDSRVGHLGMIDTNGRPRVLPVTYAIHEAAVWTAIDNKPKRPGREPARVRWLRERPHAALTVDRYEDDWSELRWVQFVGEMAVLDGPPAGEVLRALARRYPQYRADPPPGPVLRLAVTRAVWWRAS
jgi:PPOX class probable F420-dependent enzyme